VDTRELVDAQTVGMGLAVLSGLALLLAPALLALGKARGSAAATQGALLSGCAVLLYPLWRVYNLIEDHYGLDSVAALLINLALFAVVGVTAGLLLRRFWPGEATNSRIHHGDTEPGS
jgi:hypothetical protein